MIQYRAYFEGFSHFFKYTLKSYQIFYKKIKEKLVIEFKQKREKKRQKEQNRKE